MFIPYYPGVENIVDKASDIDTETSFCESGNFKLSLPLYVISKHSILFEGVSHLYSSFFTLTPIIACDSYMCI